jgi:diguanylate cyclase (GGDEF)-like protein
MTAATVVSNDADRNRRTPKDMLLIAALWLLVSFAACVAQVPAMLAGFVLDHVDAAGDDVLFLVMTSALALVAYIDRRRADLVRQLAARRVVELRLRRYDPLTGLPNRKFFCERLDEILRQAATYDEPIALLLLHLDGLEAITDVHGERVSEAVLTAFVTRATSVLRRGMVMGRIEGNVFGVVVPDVAQDIPSSVAYRILGALAEPVQAGELAIVPNLSIGIAQDTDIAGEQLIRRADWALRRAKAEGGARVHSFEPEMDQQLRRRARIERELRDAGAGAVTLDYQQVVQLDTGKICGFEALARWRSPSLGPVPAGEFIAVAEECGLIGELGDQLLRRACAEATRWPGGISLTFNLSATQLRDPSLADRLLSILGEAGVDPRRLELDIKESALLGDGESAASAIAQLRAAGMRVALDDFGMGYATLSQLLTIRIDKLKIDRLFIAGIGKDPHSEAIVRVTIGLARDLGLAAIAEGVETAAQLAVLRSEGCHQAQGHFFGLATAGSEIPTLLGLLYTTAAR